MLAIESGNFDIINAIMSKNQLDATITDNEGKNALMYAVEYGYNKIAENLVKFNKININSTDKKGRTPLMYAVETKNIATVELMVSLKSDVSIKNSSGKTARNIAEAAGFTYAANYLENLEKIK